MPVTKNALITKLENGLDPTILDDFLASDREKDQEYKPIVLEVKSLWDSGKIQVKRCYNCGMTGNGKPGFFMSGSMGTLCQFCYDDVEADL